VGPHCVIDRTVGRDNRIFQFASLGAVPQDKKYAGEPCELVIGDRNTVREFSTFNIGSPGGGGVTRVGNDNWLMAYVHLAHDCIVGNNTIFANNAQLAGHVEIGDWAILRLHHRAPVRSHQCAWHDGTNTMLLADQPPFVMSQGQRRRVR
jgi:UDP-N-acetylglucosamine acyltransferase